jgi:hypothetical protein
MGTIPWILASPTAPEWQPSIVVTPTMNCDVTTLKAQLSAGVLSRPKQMAEAVHAAMLSAANPKHY